MSVGNPAGLPPSGNPNPPPPTPHFTSKELARIVAAVPQSASALTAGGPAGGAMVRIVAVKGLGQTENAAAIEEGRDYIIWYFGQGSYILNQLPNTGAWIIFAGQGAANLTNAPRPIYALHSDGRIFRGSTQALTTMSRPTDFDVKYNNRPGVLNRIQVFQGGNWVDVP